VRRTANQTVLEQGMVFDGDTVCLPGSQPPLGYLYIAEFDPGVIKVGRSVNPNNRIQTYCQNPDLQINRIWVSPPHLTYIANELKLIRAVARMDHPTFDDAVQAAKDFNYGTDPISHLVFELRK
jgi:hypothetical protein